VPVEAGSIADAASSCGFPPIPTPSSRPIGAACAFDAGSSATPVLAAISDRDLLFLSGRGTFTKVFRFDVPARQARRIVSRGDFVGAMVVDLPSDKVVDIEFVLMKIDGTVVAHHRETHQVEPFGGAFDIVGNAGGTFAFSAAMGHGAELWIAAPGVPLIGSIDGLTLEGGLEGSPGEPDARGRLHVRTYSTTMEQWYQWLDACAGTRKKTSLDYGAGTPGGWGSKLFGLTPDGQLSTETADGVTALAYPSFGARQATLWYFVPPGVAMFVVPPFPGFNKLTGNFVTIDAATLASHAISIAYTGGLSPVGGAFLDSFGVSDSPAGFGVDSAGHATMFLRDETKKIHLFVTAHGSDWIPVGDELSYDSNFGASETLRFAEARGTYVIAGFRDGPVHQVVRPELGIRAQLRGPASLAADGGCVAVLAAKTELDIVSAVTGTTTSIPLPDPVNPEPWLTRWTSTWIPGDDAYVR
jgi:hypothetical protein